MKGYIVMEIILAGVVTTLFWILCFFLYLAENNKNDALSKHEEVRILREEIRKLRAEKEVSLPPPQVSTNNNDSEIWRLTIRLREKENKISVLKTALQEKDDDISKLKGRLNRRNAEISELNIVIRGKENEILRLKNIPRENDENAYRVTYLEGEIYAKKREITELKESLREKEAEIERLKNPPPPSSIKRFIKVKFKKHDGDTFDYFLNENYKVKVK